MAPVSLSATADRIDGVTLVTGRVRNPDRRRRVRLTSRLEGPVWPPRRHGRPAPGWDDDGVEWILAADETRPLGYASPAPPAEPPATVTRADPVERADPEAGFEPSAAVPDVDGSPAAVLADLGSPLPPRDGVPAPDEGTSSPEPGSPDRSTPSDEPDALPDPLEAWFGEVRARVAAAEGLSATTPVPEATDRVAAIGGLDGARALDRRLEADAATLRTVGERADRLADRAGAATLPVGTLERIT